MINVIKYPDKILLVKSSPVKDIQEGKRILQLLKEAIRSVGWGYCVGFAAPQIGINKRVFIANGIAYINPEIIWESPQAQDCIEGCYSLEEKAEYKLKRPAAIRMKYMNDKGKMKESLFCGFSAEVIHHEYDHLEGRLCNHYKK